MATQYIYNGRMVRMQPARPKSALSKAAEALGNFLFNYWAHLLTVGLGTLVFIAIAIPFLSYFGLDSIAKPLFYALHYMCAQIPSHSFYILGHQLGFCARNFSIYTSMFLGSLIFVLSKKRMPGIPWWVWILMLLPMAWDGLTQMFGLRESDAALRLLTGTLFGLGNVWFALPLMQKSLLETTPVAVPQAYARAYMQTMSTVKPVVMHNISTSEPAQPLTVQNNAESAAAVQQDLPTVQAETAAEKPQTEVK